MGYWPCGHPDAEVFCDLCQADGQRVDYDSENVILGVLTKEYTVGKWLFPYIPFCIAKYGKELTSGGSIDGVVRNLEYFRDGMVFLHREGVLSDGEIVELMGFVNTIITHITNGNKNEKRAQEVQWIFLYSPKNLYFSVFDQNMSFTICKKYFKK